MDVSFEQSTTNLSKTSHQLPTINNIINKFVYILLNACILLSLFCLDNCLGSGFLKLFNKILCTFVCFVRKSLKEEIQNHEDLDQSLDLNVLALEVMVLSFSMAILHQYKRFPRMDRIDEFMRQSKDSLRQTTKYLEKWRERSMTKGYSYLDEEPQETLSPINLEIPILQLAIIDHHGTTRANPETGDAGEPINVMDSTVLSVTSLVDRASYDSNNNSDGGSKTVGMRTDFTQGFLWNIVEEDLS